MPELHGSVRPAVTAARSRSRPLTKVWRLGKSSARTPLIHCGSCSPWSWVHLPESADVPGEGVEFGAAGEDGFELQVLALRQGVGVSQDPAGDRAWGWRTGRRRGRGCPERLEVGADDSVAAGVAVRLDLFPEGPGVCAALGPSPVQVGLEVVELGPAVLPLSLEQVFRPCGVGQQIGARWAMATHSRPVPAPEPSPAPTRRRLHGGTGGGGRRTARPLRRGCATGEIGRRPGPRWVPRSWHPRRRTGRGRGRRPRSPGDRPAKPRQCPPRDPAADQPACGSRRRPARSRRHGPCASRTHRRRPHAGRVAGAPGER